jgi:DNA-binding XRE family transcriptional regulator
VCALRYEQMDFEKLELWFIARGWSFTYLAVHGGLAKNTIVEVEAGRTEPRLNTVATLAASFGKTMSELVRAL